MEPIADAVAADINAAPAANRDVEGIFSEVRLKESRRAKKPDKNTHGTILIYQWNEQ